MHRQITLDQEETHVIFIPWFGIQHRFRGARTEEDELAAGVLYSTLEADAQDHELSSPDMPILLDCHVSNDRGFAFWESRGFRQFELIETPSARYHRMRR